MATAEVVPVAPSTRPDWVRRVFAPHDISGPKVRLGVLWFVIELVAVAVGLPTVTILFGLVAGAAALQTSRAWRKAGWQPSRAVAGIGGLLIPLTAGFGIALAGVVIVAIPFAALIAAGFRSRRRTPLLGAAGASVRCAVFAGLCGAMPVLLYRTSPAATLIFVVLVSAYEMGDFVNGSETDGPFAGPVAGIIAVGVFSFAIGVVVLLLEVPPFDTAALAWVFGALVAVLCPLSQIAASLVLPRADAWAPAFRRIDSFLLTGPVWLWLLWVVL